MVRAWPAQPTAPARPIRLPATDAATLVRSLSGRILRARTTIEAVHQWCDERGIGAGPIRAIRRAEPFPTPPGEALVAALAPGPDERLQCRQVSIVRGGTVLMETDTWFVPERLLPPVRRLLEATDIPFGAAIAPLEPGRRTTFLRFPHPSLRAAARELLFGTGDRRAKSPAIALPQTAVVLEVEAVILDWRQWPLAVVEERYRASVLGSTGSSSRRQDGAFQSTQ